MLNARRMSAKSRAAAYLRSLAPTYLRTTPLVLDGATWETVVLGLAGAANATIVVAFDPTAQDALNAILAGGSQEFEIGTSTTGAGIWRSRTSATSFGSLTQADASRHVFTTVYRGGQAGNATRLRLWLDGVEGSPTYSGTVPATLPAYTGERIGARLDNSAPANGTLSLVAVYASDQLANLAAIHAAVATIIG